MNPAEVYAEDKIRNLQMKTVFIVDATPMLREFLTAKLSAEKIRVESAESQRSAIARLISELPDLIILNVLNSLEDLYEFLDKKKNDINARKIPVIMLGKPISKEETSDLLQYGVIKYFAQPVKFDVFFEAIGRILRQPFVLDDTPCIIDIHLNKEIIFIEIAQGLNHEKILMLKYKLSEVIGRHKLAMPKIILVLSSLNLTFVDGWNLEYLLNCITADNRVLKKNIKILSLDKITKDFIEGHPEFHGIEVEKALPSVLNAVIDGAPADDVRTVIADSLLITGKDENMSGTLEMRLSSDDAKKNNDEKSFAVIEPDAAVRKELVDSLARISGKIDQFSDGPQFMQSLLQKHYDILITELYLNGMSGFQILQSLQEKKILIDTIIYSKMTQKEYIMQALKLGAKSYILKPQKPEVVFQKVIEIINAKE